MLIDTHCHLNDEKLLYFTPDIISTSEKDKIKGYICIGTDKKTSLIAVKESQIFNPVYATVGYHPDYANDYNEKIEEELSILAQNEKVVAIGEIGLDYYYKDCPPKEIQKDVFEKQLNLASKLNLPVVIHIRDAFGDAIEVLKNNQSKLKNGGVIHCYSGSIETAKILLDMGFYLSFNGVITFKNAKKNVEVLKTIPLDRILVETDSPYLSPEPFRGQINEPKNVNIVVDKMSEILCIDRQKLVEILNNNAKNLFKKLKIE